MKMNCVPETLSDAENVDTELCTKNAQNDVSNQVQTKIQIILLQILCLNKQTKTIFLFQLSFLMPDEKECWPYSLLQL